MFIGAVAYEPWLIIKLRLPTTSTSTCGRRDIVYAIIHALGGKLDDNLSFIGRLTEIDRCIALNERRLSNL